MISALVGGLGFTTERQIAAAGARGIVVATRGRSRSLVTVVRGSVDPAVLRERPGWDLPLEGTSEVELDGGQFTVIVEALATGIPAVDVAWPESTLPAFVVQLAEQMAGAHSAGQVVGPLQAALVFVEAAGSRLVGVAQRPLRADRGSTKLDGEPRLFATSSLTPAEVRGAEITGSDDAYRLASLIWRWRHGEDRLARHSIAEQLAVLAGTHPVAPADAEVEPRASDALDELLGRMLDPGEADRPALEDLLRALRTYPVAGPRG